MSVYLDASILVPLFVFEPASDAAERFLGDLEEAPTVSDFAAAEVSSAISRLVRTSQVTAAAGRSTLEDFDLWRASSASEVETQASDVRLAALHVRRFELTLRTPDALHLAICQRLDQDLATLDQKLARAAAVLGVRVAACSVQNIP